MADAGVSAQYSEKATCAYLVADHPVLERRVPRNLPYLDSFEHVGLDLSRRASMLHLRDPLRRMCALMLYHTIIPYDIHPRVLYPSTTLACLLPCILFPCPV